MNEKPLSPLERVLRLFTDVRPGEGGTALLMFANVFLILCSYYFIKPLRDGWISISDVAGLSKMEVKAYSSFAQAMLLIPVVSAYARLAARLSRRALITRASLFCLSNMLVFWALQPGVFFDYLPASGILFYLWVGMFGVFVVAQFWTFAADVYRDEDGRRLLPLIAIGATAGAVAGSGIAERLVSWHIVETKQLLLAAMLPLGASIVINRVVDARAPAVRSAAPARAGEASGGALGVVLRHPFLLATAIVTLLMNWVNTNGENLLYRVVQEFLALDATAHGVVDAKAVLDFTLTGTTLFYSDFYFWVNVVALVLQAFVASRLLRWGGFGAILLLLPAIALLSYSAMALVPILAVVKVMKIAENATDYSINNTARHVLWLPVSSELKFKGKPAIDTFVYRIGDFLAALTVMVGVQLLALPTQAYFVLNVALVLGWLGFAAALIQSHGRLTRENATRAPV